MAKSRIDLQKMMSSDEEIFTADNVMDQAGAVRNALNRIIETYNHIEAEYKKVWNDPKTKGKFKNISSKMASVCNKRASYARNQQVTMYRNIEASVNKNNTASDELQKTVDGAAEAMINTINEAAGTIGMGGSR